MSGYTDLHLDSSALLTIDVQNDFTLPGAPAEIDGTYQVVPAMQTAVAAYRTAGMPIVHVIRLYRPDGSNVDLPRRAAIERGAEIVAPGREGARPVNELLPDPSVAIDTESLLAGEPQGLGESEWLMYKPRWGAFFDTPLHRHLDDLEVDTVVVCGCNFPNCPRTTVYEASERDFRIGLVTDATSGLYPRARDELDGIGVHLLTASSVAEDVTNAQTTKR